MANYKNIEIVLDPPAAGESKTVKVVDTAEAILKATDWTQLPDCGLTDDCVANFKAYRANIRVIRKLGLSNPTWPDAPAEEWK
jgi:hypothetical protein